MPNIPILLFSKGEVTPLIDARNDTEVYQAACRHLENFIARMYGDAERRPGTKYIAGMRDSDDSETVAGVSKALLVPFIYSEDVAYLLEFTQYHIRVFYDDTLLDSLASPYLETDLFDLQFKQLGDVIWITHNDYAQRKFLRVSTSYFALEPINFEKGPFMTRNDLAVGDGITMKNSGNWSGVTDDQTDTGCTMDASSEYSTAYAAEKAVDDLFTTKWQSSGATNQWISCYWSGGKAIKQVRFLCAVATPYSNYNAKHVKIQRSDNGTDWTKCSINAWYGNCAAYNTDEALLDNMHRSQEWVRFGLNNSTSYNYWRIYVTDVYDRMQDDYYVDKVAITELEMSTDAASTENFTLTCSADYFSADHVGTLFSLTQVRVNTEVTITKAATVTDEYSDELLVEGQFNIDANCSTGAWTGTLLIERKIDVEGTWETYRTYKSNNLNRVIQFSGVEEDINCYYRIHIESLTLGTLWAAISVMDSTQTGICKVVKYVSTTQVEIDILKDFASTEETTKWAEGAWSTIRGYPISITFIEGRCVYGGMKSLANDTKLATVWLSAVDDYEDFDEGVKGGDAFSLTIPTTETLSWVEAMDNLIIATEGDTWFVRSSKMDTPLVPDPPPIVRQQSGYGCDPIRPVDGGKALLYISGRQLRELAYDREASQFDADMTALAEHFTASPIVQMAMQYDPEMILWCVHNNGDFSAFVYDRENNVTAWCWIVMAGDVQSVCVLPHSDQGDDVYITINRTITGKTVVDGEDTVYDGDEIVTDKLYPIYIEKFAQRFE